MWKGVTGSLGPCGGGGIAEMVVGSQWRSWAARVYRAAVMMWWACPSRAIWRSVPKWWGRSQGEGFYSVEGDGVLPGPVGQDVYARVSRYGAQVHVARDGGGRQRLAQGRGAWGGAGRVMVLTPGVVDDVRCDVYGEGSDGALEFLGLDVVEARHRPCVGAPFADPHGVCPRRRWVQAVRGDACDRAVVGGI